MEIWHEVYGFDHLYEISSLGRLRTKYAGKRGYTNEYHYIEPLNNGNGYLRFNLRCNKTQRTVYVHKLVAEYFIDNPYGYTEVNHKDENKKNNCVDNLEWCSHIYNTNYGTMPDKIRHKKSKRIKCVETNQVFGSLKEAAEVMNVSNTSISNCINRRSKTAAGYTWEYIDV